MLITIVVIVAVVMAAAKGPKAGFKALAGGLIFIALFWIVVVVGLGALTL